MIIVVYLTERFMFNHLYHTAALAALLFLGNTLWGQMQFVQNKGQWPDHVGARVSVGAGAIYIEDGGITYYLVDEVWASAQHPGVPDSAIPFKAHAYKMNLLGASPPTSWEQTRPLDAYHNYYLGNDPSKWTNKCTVSERVHVSGVYPSIDAHYYSRNGALKYDFKVRPGGNPTDIQFAFEGVKDPVLRKGDLVLETAIGQVVEKAPFAFQLIDGKMVEVDCAYALNNGQVHFELGEYDPAYTLTIDPEVVFASYIGASSYNFGFTAANDSEGNLIAGAIVFGNTYPTTLGSISDTYNSSATNYCDATVSKFSSDGSSLLYSTFLGGDRAEMPHSIVCDSQDNWIVMGNTGSTNFPTTTGSFQPTLEGGPLMTYADYYFGGAVCPEGVDIFLSKFSADGTGFEASTFVGGSDTDGLNGADMLLYNYGDCFRGEIIVDDQDRVLVCTTTESDDFPMNNTSPFMTQQGGDFDGVVFRMNEDLSIMEWASYLGGAGNDSGFSVQLADNGDIVVCGGTWSSDFPVPTGAAQSVHGGGVDGYVLRFSADGSSLEGGTFVGQSGYQQTYFVQLNASDEIFVYGQTEGDMAVSADVFSNPGSGQFIRKYTSDLTALSWTTTIGTGSEEVDISPTAFLVSDCDWIYFTGWGGDTNANNSPYASFSSTDNMPITADAPQSTTDGNDFYLGVLSQEAQELVFGTFLGGNVSSEHVDGGTAKFDKNGSVYQAVCAGCGGNSDFPTTAGSYSEGNVSTHCNLAVFKFDLGTLQAQLDIDGPAEVCEGSEVQFENNSFGGTQYQWDFGDGFGSTAFEPTHIYESNGTFEVSLIVSDEFDCLPSDTAYLSIEIIPGVNPTIDPIGEICPGESIQLFANGSSNLYWVDNGTLSDTEVANPTVTPTEPTTYYAVDFNDCESDTIGVYVGWYEALAWAEEDAVICIGSNAPLTANGAVTVNWTPADEVDVPTAANTFCHPDESMWIYAEMTDNNSCTYIDSVFVEVFSDWPGGLVYDPISLCNGSSVLLEAEPGNSWSWSPPLGLSATGVQSPNASPTTTTTYYVDVTNACGTGTSEVTITVITPTVTAGDDGLICQGQWHPIWASDAATWSWAPLGSISEPTSQQTSVSPGTSTTYTVTATDEFGCIATDEVHVEVLPLPDVNIPDPGTVYWLDEVELTGYTGTGDFMWSPAELLSCEFCENPTFIPEEPTWVFLETTDSQGCTGRDSVLIDLVYPIYVPNAFTPDQDGINDVFFASGEGITGFHMRIVNRWGNLVFESFDIQTVWDGSFQGGAHYVQNDVYVWTIEYNGKAGKVQLMGHVTVVR